MSVDDIIAVQTYRKLVQRLLDRASELKQSSAIEPPITESDLGDVTREIDNEEQETLKNPGSQSNYAAVETAFREKFYHLLATTSINEPEFVDIWNLLDVVSIFSDNERCEPGLIFWLIEELLDSQTIEGCRKVFDYLESRRERNTAKHFKQKSLIILRSCNELLRRLSRAEDTVFCGRVFIFLFQSFPLGDKSSVNLRGEYHTENVTAFDELPQTAPNNENVMDVDMQDSEASKPSADSSDAAPDAHSQTDREVKRSSAIVGQAQDTSIDMDSLYPIFWRLQENFSAPTRLFDAEQFSSFKKGLETTISSFQKVSIDLEKRGMTKGSEESARRGIKRKRTENGTEAANNFNPKYLTSRDLFELEVNDVAFRRHILVQSLILLDFLISLTPKAKAKLADATNKSVLYSHVLSDDDAKWAAQMKSSIATYLQKGADGKFYYRMVDTVLTRDKNWVRWKAEGCPPIERPSVQIQDYLDTQSSAVKLSTNKRLRATPLGSLDLRFLYEDANLDRLDRLKEQDRFENPQAELYLRGIADDDFNIEMAQADDEKDEAVRAKASKMWRILRLSSRSKLYQFDRIEDGKNLKMLFESSPAPEKAAGETGNGVDSQKDEPIKNESKEDEPVGE